MKILKSIFILILFSNLIISCTVDDITEETETNTIKNTQAISDDEKVIDETEKG